MRIIFRNNSAAPYFAARTAGSGYSDKIRHLFRDILISPDEVIVIKKITVMMDPQGNGPGYIHSRSAADADDRIAVAGGKRSSPLLHIRFHRVLMNIREHLHRESFGPQV